MAFNVENLMQAAIKDFKPYQAKEYPGVIKLDANENPFPWPSGLKEEIAERVIFNRYPDPEARQVRNKIGAYTGVDPESIMVGNGSDELIQLLMLAFGGPGTKNVVAVPTFTMYSLATAYTGGEIVEVPLADGVSLDVDGVIAAAKDEKVRLVIICNPNNPTGNSFPLVEIRKIIAGTDKLVVVDEAYYEFAGSTLAGELGQWPNLVVLRTFSKAFGMAGLRIGYLLAGMNIINVLQRVRQPYNSNVFSQTAGALAFDYLPQFQAQVRDILQERDKLMAFLLGLDLDRVYPSNANFILFRPKQGAKEMHAKLLANNVLIRYMGYLPVVGETLRVSPGLPEENRQFMEIMALI